MTDPPETAFVRRTLHSHLGPQDPVPPLLPLDLLDSPSPSSTPVDSPTSASTSDGTEDLRQGWKLLDHEAQMVLALLLRDAVLPWYSKLTPDRQLLSEIHRILGHVVRTIVGRFMLTDPKRSSSRQLAMFLRSELPSILLHHFQAFRQAESHLGSAYAQGLALSSGKRDIATELAELYSAMHPHPALSSSSGASLVDGNLSQPYVESLTDTLLLSLMPHEDIAPNTERYIVRDVLVGVLRNALGKLSRPWYIVQSLNKTLDAAGVPSYNVQERKFVGGREQESTEVSASTVSPIQRILALLHLIFVTLVPHLVRLYTGFFDLDFITPTSHSGGGSTRALHLNSLELEANIPGFNFEPVSEYKEDHDHQQEGGDEHGYRIASGDSALRKRANKTRAARIRTRAERQQPSETTDTLETRTPGGRAWSVYVTGEGEDADEPDVSLARLTDAATDHNSLHATEQHETKLHADDAHMQAVLSGAAESSRRKRKSVRATLARIGTLSRIAPAGSAVTLNGSTNGIQAGVHSDSKQVPFLQQLQGFLTFYVAVATEALVLSRTLVGQAVLFFLALLLRFSAPLAERYVFRLRG